MDISWKRIIYLICAIQVGAGITIIGVLSFIPLYLVDLGPVSYTHLDVYKRQTVYDLILANYGIDRGIGGEVAKSYTCLLYTSS